MKKLLKCVFGIENCYLFRECLHKLKNFFLFEPPYSGTDSQYAAKCKKKWQSMAAIIGFWAKKLMFLGRFLILVKNVYLWFII